MANKKSNKTEHVMRLITKEVKASGEGGEALGGAGPAGVSAALTQTESELSYKAKLKIEIEPEIGIKEARSESAAMEAAMRDWGLLEEGGGPGAGRSSGQEGGPGDVPDGVPFENRDDDIVGAVFAAANMASRGLPETLEEVRASIKKDEEKRVRNIEFMEELFGFNSNLVNISEVLVRELMPSIMDKMGVCKCNMCVTNVMALTLNSLPPRYVTTDVGKQYSQLEIYKSQHELDTIQALTKACLKVKESPRHAISEG